jgi:hypothetical protein
MKNILLVLIISFFISCGPRTGIHEEETIVKPRPIKVEICIVKSIALTPGKYQSFIITVKNKDKIAYKIYTDAIDFTVGDSVMMINKNVLRNIHNL